MKQTPPRSWLEHEEQERPTTRLPGGFVVLEGRVGTLRRLQRFELRLRLPSGRKSLGLVSVVLHSALPMLLRRRTLKR
jgi:hypothetical protein